MAEEQEYISDAEIPTAEGGAIFAGADKIKGLRHFDKVPTVKINKCPWCGGLDSIVNNQCQMPGCGKPVIYKGPRPREEPALSEQEIAIIVAQKQGEMQKILSMGSLPGDLRSMRAEINKRKDVIRGKADIIEDEKPVPKREMKIRRSSSISVGPGDPFKDF